MFCGKKASNKINKLHGKTLRIVYQDDISNFEELLEKDNSLSIHHQNIQRLANEMYKVHNGLSENSFYDIFENSRSSYNLRSQRDLGIRSASIESYGKNSIK